MSEQQIAKAVEQAVGERVGSRKQLIQETIERLDSDQPLSASVPPAPDTETNEPTVKPVPPDESRSLTLRDTALARRSDRGIITWLAAGAAALVLVVIVLALGLDRADEPEPVAAAASVEATASSEPTEPADPQQVLIMIAAQPPSAEVRLDDEPQGANPLVRRVPADGSKHVAVVTAAGHEPQTRRLTFDQEQEIVVRLEPLPDSTSRSQPTSKPPPVVTSRPVGPRPTVTGPKPTRPIDTNNPFGEGG